MADIREIRELFDLVKFQNWEHLFELVVPHLYEEKVGTFYHNLEISDDSLYLTSQVNGVAMVLYEDTL